MPPVVGSYGKQAAVDWRPIVSHVKSIRARSKGAPILPEKDVRSAKLLYGNLQNEEYKTQIDGVYGRLRATIEKVVEEQLVYRVVVRHRDYINLRELRKTAAITDDHCLRVKTLFDKCSGVTDAHHRSPSRSFSVP